MNTKIVYLSNGSSIATCEEAAKWSSFIDQRWAEMRAAMDLDGPRIHGVWHDEPMGPNPWVLWSRVLARAWRHRHPGKRPKRNRVIRVRR